MHLAIVSLAFDIPIFRPNKTFNGKYATLTQFDTVAAFDTNEIDPNWFTIQLKKTRPSLIMPNITRQLSQHWDEIASALAAGKAKSTTYEVIGQFWETLPGLLEDGEYHHNLAQKQLAESRKELDELQIESDQQKKEFNELKKESDKRKEELDGLKKEFNMLIQQHNRTIEEYKTLLAEHIAERDAIYKSNSWKITSPLRALRRKVEWNKPNPGGKK
jgi:hypothetical protein